MPFILFPLSYISLSLFLYEYYVVYFITIVILTLFYVKSAWLPSRKSFIFALFSILISPFLFEYFDDTIFEIALFFDLNHLYYFVGGEVAYVLSALHCFIFFLSYNGKKYLIG